jgi:hypothetical protein
MYCVCCMLSILYRRKKGQREKQQHQHTYGLRVCGRLRLYVDYGTDFTQQRNKKTGDSATRKKGYYVMTLRLYFQVHCILGRPEKGSGTVATSKPQEEFDAVQHLRVEGRNHHFHSCVASCVDCKGKAIVTTPKVDCLKDSTSGDNIRS